LGEKKKLNVLPLKPMTLEEMKKHFKQNDTTAAMAAQVLYGGVLNGSNSTANLEGLDLLEAEQSNRFVYATYLADLYPEIAKALALRFVDKTAVKGKTYFYFLQSDVKKDKGFVLEESATMVNTTILTKAEALESVDAIGLDKNVRIFWSRLEGDSKYTAYQIERKEGNKPFTKRTSAPFVNPDNPNDTKDDESIVFMDSIPRNYVPYAYRIRGITAYGETGNWSQITVSGRDLTPPGAPVNVVAASQGGKKVRISWRNPFKDIDHAGFVIGRSENYEGPYTPIDDKLYAIGDTLAFDLNASVHQRNFYLVSAIDTAGNAARSLPAYVIIADGIAPVKPVGLTAIIDSLGVVKLHWEMGKEADLAGYNIYRANSQKEEFSVINKAQVMDNNYMDMVDINSLTKNAYYKIVAFDKTNNPSAYSAVVAIKKPDYIPPTAPQITDFWVDEHNVKLKLMASNSSDLKEYYVYRKMDSVFEKVGTLLKSDTVFVDSKLPEKDLLWYTLVAVDSSGLLSEQSFPQRIQLPIKGIKLPDLMLRAKKSDKGVTISWDRTKQLPAGAKLMLYKSYGKDQLEQYTLINNLKADYTDVEVRKGEAVKYALRLQLPNGNVTALSTAIEITM
jgi:fibronectin type 3 domain-containing protein